MFGAIRIKAIRTHGHAWQPWIPFGTPLNDLDGVGALAPWMVPSAAIYDDST